MFNYKNYLKSISLWEVLVMLVLSGFFIMINYLVVLKAIIHSCNEGVAFGLRLPYPIFPIVWSIVMLVIISLWGTTSAEAKKKRYGFLLIVSGGLANIADRMIHGCVIDYIALVPWNVFNLADVSIFCGAMLVLWDMHRSRKLKI